MLDETVDDKDLEIKDDEEKLEDKETEEKGSDDWKDKQKVPYRRLEVQSRQIQQSKKTIDELTSELNALKANKSENKPAGTWDNRIKNAQSWDEVFDELPSQFLEVLLKDKEKMSKFASAIKGDLKNEEKQVEEKVNREIDALWDNDILTSKDEENRVIKYAIKESEESGEYIPLAVAVRMMKKEGVWNKNVEDRKDANNKIRPGNGAGGSKDVDKSNYRSFQHESIDSLVAKAASKFNK